ncbi:MAG: VCBS repeat-containing protein [Sandaracinaceae bacterium]|nr:VCBS repeat-containing protein [Sandaracinaceae bacterium]
MRFASMCLTVLLLTVLLLAGCDCEGTVPPAGCGNDDDCATGQVCVDGSCVARSMDAGGDADAGSMGGDAGVDGGAGCPSMTICGTPPMCCDVGDECVEGACLPACASGVRCGVDRTTCCGTDQVCISSSCEDPGDTCADSFECPMGQFCEPTLGRCLPQFDPVTCETTPVFGDFEPTIEWSMETATLAPDCMHGISAPVIVDVDGDGVPEVVVNFACDDDWQRGVVRALRGDTGEPVWEATDAARQTNGRAGIAGADLDGDGRAEIVGVRMIGVNRAIAFDDDGSILWLSTQADGTTPLTMTVDNGAPTIADLDHDGSPEIIFGAVVLDAMGRLVWTRDTGAAEGTNSGYTGGISAVADIDMDGEPEIVSGRHAYEANGDPVWTATTPDGYPAIAQFDADPQPEVVLVASGNVYVLDGMTGAIEWGPTALPGGGRGGPPTVADFDGDGAPEIGVAGAGSYSVYDLAEPTGVLWSRTTQDVSSNATGSSVFDFEGDGAAEVVYGDECYMRVYRGSDGTVLLEIDSTSSTIHEYPLVADVDADGNSEIVIVANNRGTGLPGQCRAGDAGWDGARAGVFVYGDTRDQWVGTRRVWNQHAYHVTNIAAAGTVPRTEVDNWSTPGLNNYRQNAQGEGVYNAPDLVVLALEVVLDGCPDDALLRARVANEGNLGVPAGVPVSFYTGTPAMRGALLGTVATTVPLLPGASTVVELPMTPLTGAAPYAFVAVVDDDGTGAGIVVECDEDDNAGGIGDLTCDILL